MSKVTKGTKVTKGNKYKTLCEAYKKGVEECDSYRKECREFVHDIKNSIMESLNCPETKVFMFSPSSGFVFNNQTLQGDCFDTEFGENGTAAIGFAINVNGDDLEEKFFNFILIFKKIDSQISLNIDDERDFYDTPEGIENFCNYLFEMAQNSLENRLKKFLQSPNTSDKPIGFRMNPENNK